MLKKKSQNIIENPSKAIIDITGANCTSCVYTIEHVGRKISGVKDCYVDRNSSQIQLEYDGQESTLEKIVSLVDRIGYSAMVVEREAQEF